LHCTHTRKAHLTVTGTACTYPFTKHTPALNLSRHLAHITRNTKETGKGSHKHTQQDDGIHTHTHTHTQEKPLQFLSPSPCYRTGWPLSGSIKISKTVYKQKHVVVAKKMQLSCSQQESWELTCSNSERIHKNNSAI
jgi:hypothetical protein